MFYSCNKSIVCRSSVCYTGNDTARPATTKKNSMARKLSSFERVVVSQSLLQSVTIHPVSPCFSLGMEEWIDSYIKSLDN